MTAPAGYAKSGISKSVIVLGFGLRVQAAPTGDPKSTLSSMGNAAGVAAMVLGIPAAIVAVLWLMRYTEQRRPRRESGGDQGTPGVDSHRHLDAVDARLEVQVPDRAYLPSLMEARVLPGTGGGLGVQAKAVGYDGRLGWTESSQGVPDALEEELFGRVWNEHVREPSLVHEYLSSRDMVRLDQV